MTDTGRRVGWWFVWFSLSAFVVAALLTARCWKAPPTDPLEAWATLEPGDRYSVAERIAESGVLVGLTRAELESRLGAPAYEHDRGTTLGWYVGDPPGTWLTGDSYFLEVRLEGGKTTSARIFCSRF